MLKYQFSNSSFNVFEQTLTFNTIVQIIYYQIISSY